MLPDDARCIKPVRILDHPMIVLPSQAGPTSPSVWCNNGHQHDECQGCCTSSMYNTVACALRRTHDWHSSYLPKTIISHVAQRCISSTIMMAVNGNSGRPLKAPLGTLRNKSTLIHACVQMQSRQPCAQRREAAMDFTFATPQGLARDKWVRWMPGTARLTFSSTSLTCRCLVVTQEHARG